ncbi:MAG TPA: response regulator [Leptospiraceae bacterium]|nr:response regulator [Leptospiraceae bacterium]
MSKKVLIIDDSASIRKVVSLTLKGAGYEVEEAVDVQDGIAKISAAKYSLIICDVNMPNMDGLTFLRTMRQNESAKFTRPCRPY